jgi:hypothetical protein
MTALLTIEKQDYKIENVEFPSYITDMTSDSESFVEVKQDLQEVFTEFFHSEQFKTNDNTEGFRILHYSLNKLLDDLFMAHNNGRANHIQDKIDKFHNPDKEEPKKEVLN